jgi:predicted outer membrane protein
MAVRLGHTPDGPRIVEERFMKTRLIAAFASGALMVLTVPSLSMAQSMSESAMPSKITPDFLLNRANQMNKEEQNMMSLAQSKVGDNQALKTMATTITDDHKANQQALEALAKQENVNLQNNGGNNSPAYNRLKNLKGAAFNQAFLNAQIRDHEQALRLFEDARDQPENRDMMVYIGQTIPILRAHLQMAKNLKNDMMAMGSSENPTNNKQSNGNGNNANNNGGASDNQQGNAR